MGKVMSQLENIITSKSNGTQGGRAVLNYYLRLQNMRTYTLEQHVLKHTPDQPARKMMSSAMSTVATYGPSRSSREKLETIEELEMLASASKYRAELVRKDLCRALQTGMLPEPPKARSTSSIIYEPQFCAWATARCRQLYLVENQGMRRAQPQLTPERFAALVQLYSM